MKTIYLASASRARRRLLRQLGIPFRVLISRVPERRCARGLSFPELVKANALAKARAAAARLKTGLVIGADTIVVQNGQIFGKPRSLRHARQMLKQLGRAPQWVYSGVTVLDARSGKARSAYEKTKVYLDRLSDEQIAAYFARVNPLDKAGSFDIQGRGALFIRRIEGCFYNVVGLPLRTLFRLLRAFDIRLLLVLWCAGALALSSAGCATEYNLATKEEEVYFYSTEREVRLGEAIDREIREDRTEEYKLIDDPLVQKRIEDIGKRIAAVCDRRDIDYHFTVLKNDDVNAVSMPGGYVYIFSGLIDKTANDDQLAAVVAHEVAHIVARHSIKRLQALSGYSFLRLLTLAVPGGGGAEVGAAADAAFTQLLLGYAREDELLADQLGARYLARAGYSPRAMLDFLERLEEVNKRRPLQPRNYFKTHPYVPDRRRIVKQELGEKMGFSDYINIEQQPHGQ